MPAPLYTTLSWRELKVIAAAKRILEAHNYYVAAGQLRAVANSQTLPMHRAARGPGSMVRTRPTVRTVELPPMAEQDSRFPRLQLPAPKEMRALDASRL